jgi:rhodanese-related sulfurtransferase
MGRSFWRCGVLVLIGIGLVLSGYSIGGAFVSQEQLMKLHYATEAAALVSPHHLREAITHANADNYIIVDTREVADYEREHIIGAINIPGSLGEDNVEEMFAAYQALDNSKEVVIYCYSAVCMRGRKVGLALAREGIYVKELGIGWNEWRYDWTAWNYPEEWDLYAVEEYVFSGKEPGVFVPDAKNVEIAPCEEGEAFGC